jgi:hypothetical protein
MTERQHLTQIRKSLEELELLIDEREREETLRRNTIPSPAVPDASLEPPMTEKEAAIFLKKSRQTLRMWRYAGLIKAYRIGGRIFYKKDELLAALQAL